VRISRALCAAALALLSACSDSAPPQVASIALTPGSADLAQGQTTTLVASLADGRGNALSGRTVTWTSGNPAAVVVSAAGVVTGVRGGVSVITASAEGRTASATVTVRDTVAAVAVTPAQLTLFPGAVAALTASATSDAGVAILGRTVNWSSSATAVVAVTAGGQLTAVAPGSATITATVDGRSGTAAITVQGSSGEPGAPPAITSVSPAVLAPGATATIEVTGVTGTFPAVTIAGAAAPVTSVDGNRLRVTVPCVPSTGAAPVVVTANGASSVPVTRPLQVATRHDLAPGQSVLVDDISAMACAELAGGAGAQRFVMAVYNSTVSSTAQVDYRIAGHGGSGAAAVPTPWTVNHALADARGTPAPLAGQAGTAPPTATHGITHHELLEKNRVAYEALMREHGPAMRAAGELRAQAATATTQPPLNATIRVSNITSSSICTNFFTIQATRVYYAGRLAIYEDDATPDNLKAANNPAMANYYRQIGDQYNADMEPIVRTYFGDPLRRDAVTDNDGVLRAVFTPVINNNLQGTAGFVVSCDQFPVSPTNTASNFGEYFYAYQPTNTNTGFNTGTPEQWFRLIRSTFIHEAKHVASQAARVANSSPSWEVSWLEEGTARHAEELWSRNAVYNVPWRGNTGYGGADNPGSVWCDVRPSWAVCNGTNPRRPSSSMFNHFATLYAFLGNPGGLSPFGRAPGDASAVFYAASWSLVRYAVDRFASSEQAFFTALNQSTTSGAANLAARSGISMNELLGRWALALYADDRPGLTGRPELQFATWNMADVYTGMRTDFPSSYPRVAPLVTTPLSFGTFAPLQRTGLVGGGIDYFEFSGTNSGGQAVRIESLAGGPPSGVLRMAILRVQ
jgi:hypothetical protein